MSLLNCKKCSCAANQHIRMVSESSCSEDLSYYAENSSLHDFKKLHFKIWKKKNRKLL